MGDTYVPKCCDTTLQNDDQWFFYPEYGIRELADLQNVYHQTVGSGGVLEMDFAIDRTGNVAPEHAARYKELGDWVRACYGNDKVVGSGKTDGISDILVEVDEAISFDRFVLKEDMSVVGQAITGFSITSGDTVHYKSDLAGIGNKKIIILDAPVRGVSEVTFSVTASLVESFGEVSFALVSGDEC